MQPDFRRSDRGIWIGQTGRGKSVGIRYEFMRLTSQRICIDVNNAESFVDADGKPVPKVRDVKDIDWKSPLIHYVPRDPYDQAEYEELFKEIFRRRDLAIWLDEAYGPTKAGHGPPSLRLILTQGRKRNLRVMAATQRPVHILRDLIAAADHVIVYPVALGRRDLKTVAEDCGMESAELEAMCAHVIANQNRYGEFGYLHFERRRNHVHFREAVPFRA